MLTRIAPDLPGPSPRRPLGGSIPAQIEQLYALIEQQARDYERLKEAITAWHERLNKAGMLTIEGGLIDNTPIGLNAAASGAFTTLAASGAVSMGNTVNTVNPTAPNRTVTIVIGGTTYYLHAKTTND